MVFSGDLAERRNVGPPTEEDMTLVEGRLRDRQDSAPAVAGGVAKSEAPSNVRIAAVGGAAAEAGSAPVMRHRLRDCYAFWESIGACEMVLGWIWFGFMACFSEPCPGCIWAKPNQPC